MVGRPRKLRDESGRMLMTPAFGPDIPIVPRSHFNQSVDFKTLETFWRITGPSAMHNIQMGHPFWAVIACAYAEGLNHGAQLIRDKDPIAKYREIPIRGKK